MSRPEKMTRGNPMFDDLSNEDKKLIIDFNARSVGRPPATEQMKVDAKDKKRLRERGRARLKAASQRGDLDGFLKTLDDMKMKDLLGDKAVDTELTRFIGKNKDVVAAREERVYEDKAEDLVSNILGQAQKEVRIEEGAPVKLKVVDKFSEQIPAGERTQQKMTEAAQMRAATKKMMAREREEAIAKRSRSQLSDHFSSYDKSSTDETSTSKASSSVEDAKKPDRPMDKLDFNEISNDDKKKIKNLISNNAFAYDNDELEFIWNNTMEEGLKDGVLVGNNRSLETLRDLIMVARHTEEFVPDYLEANNEMTKEERQIEFHKELIVERMSAIQKKRLQKPVTNFENNTKMGGGIDSGIPLRKEEESKYGGNPKIFQDYEQILDSKITDNAYNRELYKGINPNTVSTLGKTNEEDDDFFRELNAISNMQDNEEINSALRNIEVLSGGQNDSLFGAQDLLSTRRNNPASRGNFQQDIPDDIDDAPAPITRGRNAQALEEIDPELIARQDRVDNVTTIALGLGALGSAYRGMFGRNDIPATRKNDILTDMNQNMKMMGRRGLYAEDLELKKDNDMYEGAPSFATRINDMENYAHYRDYHSMGGVRNPMMLQHAQERQKAQQADNQLASSMSFNQGQPTMGSSLPQLREQEFAYKQANAQVAHDGYSFIRGGKATGIKIQNEFEA